MGVLYLQVGGGLGDFIDRYFRSYEWNVIPSIKQMYPDCMITCVVACHNPSVGELIYSNPHIDGVLAYRWFPPGHAYERAWHHLISGTELGPWARSQNFKVASEVGLQHRLYLLPREEDDIKRISDITGKYIVMHPYAGLPYRGCRPHPIDGEYKCYPDFKYARTANYLAEQGYAVAIVGRTSSDGQDLLRSTPEVFDTPVALHPNVIDLTNRVSLRTNVELTRRANGFIGSHSSMLAAAWTADVPSVFFYPSRDEHGNSRSVVKHGGTTGTWALDKPFHNYFEMTGPQFCELDPLVPAQLLLRHVQ